MGWAQAIAALVPRSFWNTRTHTFAYNALGDRLRQTVDGVPTPYTVDPSASLRAGLAAGLTQVLSAGGTAYLYGNGRIGEEQPGGRAYHLPDALGSLRQLADSSANVTLARTYEPFGDPLSTVGTGTSIYGFTGEQRDGTGLVYLRARYYGSYLNQWIQPDPLVADPYNPADWHRYSYVRNNPVNFVDPSGEYGSDVHYDLTRTLVTQSRWYGALPLSRQRRTDLADLIAAGNLRVDNPWTSLSPILACQECHFLGLAPTRRHVGDAIAAGNPFLFGATLHQVQDWYAHFNEGYRVGYGHGPDSLRAGRPPFLAREYGGRAQYLLDDFYLGGHREGGTSRGWRRSPYPQHPILEVIGDVVGRNPGVNLSGVSTNELIDLYLRRDAADPNWGRRVEERTHFGLDTDWYMSSSSRERAMSSATIRYVDQFLFSILVDPCRLEWEIPDDGTIRSLLTQ